MKTKQQGIALIMILVFLVLMTLISATTIQQNSLQFAMVGNMQEQNQSYTQAENILKQVEQNIEQARWSDARWADPENVATNTQCKETAAGSGVYALITPGTNFDMGISGNTAIVQSWWCLNNPDIALPDIDQDGDGVVDINFGRTATCTIDDVAAGGCPTIPTIGYAPFPDPAPVAGFITGCGTELYTIRVTFLQQNASGAERVVESKYAVRCLTPGN